VPLAKACHPVLQKTRDQNVTTELAASYRAELCAARWASKPRETYAFAVVKTLRNVLPTPEQAKVVDNDAPGFWLIRGAAGSGKTTTALLRLKFLVRYWRDRRIDLGLVGPVRVLVLTFNRTLRGYIEELARQQIQAGPEVHLEIATFGGWSQALMGRVVLDHGARAAQIQRLAKSHFAWPARFLLDEVDYVLGRFLPPDRDGYLAVERTGRGIVPQVPRALRADLLEKVVEPYEHWKRDQGVQDWADLAAYLATHQLAQPYDVVIVDETQDFSANQIRAVANHLSDEFVCTFIRDTVQRIYPNFFTWREAGVEIPTAQNRRLTINYRNTKQIAAFARPLVDGLEAVEDGSIPDFSNCTSDGPKPAIVVGSYSRQVDRALEYLEDEVAEDESVAFLHPKGGGWFRELRRRLDGANVEWVSLTREADWPQGDEQVALSTMHSAKGLEFDHVILLGYDSETVAAGDDAADVLTEGERRLLAMAVGRSRKGVLIGYRASARSRLLDFLDAETYDVVEL
jgi:superfamily I DNA/RNA helicase